MAVTQKQKSQSLFFEQIIPITLTFLTLSILWAGLFFALKTLNAFPIKDKISLRLMWADVLVGGTVYLKTSVDFAIFMGKLMGGNLGWKNRIAIEMGTALGNALGTILILIIWIFFREAQWLLTIMLLLSSLVLFELAHSGLEHFELWKTDASKMKRALYNFLSTILKFILTFTKPITSKIVPDFGKKLGGSAKMPWKQLLIFAFTVPFILGLDDFAGYVPLFNIVNVFGFSLGAISAHTILNIALFLSPSKTITIVRSEWVSFLGTLAFIALGFWGLIEALKIILH